MLSSYTFFYIKSKYVYVFLSYWSVLHACARVTAIMHVDYKLVQLNKCQYFFKLLDMPTLFNIFTINFYAFCTHRLCFLFDCYVLFFGKKRFKSVSLPNQPERVNDKLKA